MNKNTAKQKLKDLRTKLANLDIEIRALISKGEMEPGLIDAVVSDIDSFTQEIVKIKGEIAKINAKGLDESLNLLSLFKEGAKDSKKTPDDIAIEIAKNIEIPDYVLNDENLFAQLLTSLRKKLNPKKISEESTTGGEGYLTKYAFKKNKQ